MEGNRKNEWQPNEQMVDRASLYTGWAAAAENQELKLITTEILRKETSSYSHSTSINFQKWTQ